jgi:outer membrane protein assembly factor BamB
VRHATTLAGDAIDPNLLAQILAQAAAHAQAAAQAHATAQAAGAAHDARAQAFAHEVAPRRGGCLGLIVAGSMFGLLVVGGAVAYLVAAPMDGDHPLQQMAAAVGEAVPGVAQAMTPRFTVDWVGGPPIVATIAGEEAFVVRTRRVLEGDALGIAAFRARDGERLWSVDDVGTYTDGYRAIWAAVAGSSVVVTDARGTLRVLDAASGKELARASLSDRAAELCGIAAEAGQPDRVWLQQVDERSAFVGLTDAALTPAPRPPACPEIVGMNRPEQGLVSARSRGDGPQGLQLDRVFEVDGQRVALAVKHPGTALPKVAGLAKTGADPRWVADVGTVDPLSVEAGAPDIAAAGHGRFVVPYRVGSETTRLTSFDPITGARHWDVELRPIFAVDRVHGLRVTPTHVLVQRMGSVEVFEAATGKQLTVVGFETYD